MIRGSDLSDLAPQEATGAKKAPHRKHADFISLAIVLAAFVKLWLKDLSFDDVADVSITLIATVSAVEMLWRYRKYIPRVIVFVILPRRMAAGGHGTKWPLS